jgi:hypothetical protein
MGSVRIVEKEAGHRRRPVGQHTPEPTSRDRFMNAIVVVGVEDAEPLQGTFDDDIGVIGN